MASSAGNGESALQELFALTDEQILEMEPKAQEAVASGEWRVASQPTPHTTGLVADEAAQSKRDSSGASLPRNDRGEEQRSGPLAASAQGSARHEAPNDAAQAKPAPQEPPKWLAETMNDPQRGGEAKEFWTKAQEAQQEAAAYHEVFAKPEEARTAAERARILDEIDRAFFAGDAAERARLAAMMMREDPAAFREMVFQGLRALEEANGATRSSIGASSAGDGQSAPRDAGLPTQLGRVPPGAPPASAPESAQLAAYAAFEKAANEDLERSVGGVIEKTLEQALPNTGKPDGSGLKSRLSTTIRQEIEKTLQSDRQLGQQVAQILSSRRFDEQTRGQVVRLIHERAQQLVPSTAKRVINEWTQTTLAAHRGRTQRADSASAQADLAPASAPARPASRESAPRGSAQADLARSRQINYRTLSDEQILDM